MIEKGETLLWIGLAIDLVFFLLILLKQYRNRRVLFTLFTIGIFSSIFGIALIGNPAYQLKEVHAASMLFSPMIYITLYQVLRVAHKRITGLEPAYEFASLNDTKDRRALGVGDYIVFLVPLLAALLIPLFVW